MIDRCFFCLLFFCAACGQVAPNDPQLEILYAGTFSVRGSQGVYVYQYDRKSTRFQALEQVSGPDSPSFLDISPDSRFLYTANRQGIGTDSLFGSVCAYQIDTLSGKLRPINQSSSFGVSPCHVSVDDSGQWLYLSHYAGGSVSVFPILSDGSIGPLLDSISHHGHSIHPERQEAPHIHSAQTVPGTNYFLVADLGTDQLFFYKKSTDRIQAAPIAPIQTKPGAGPRHFAFSEGAKFIYIAEELSSSVSVYALNLPNKTTTFLQRLTTLPADFQDLNTVADIHISPDGQFLYVSNRGHDSLAIYRIDQENGMLYFVGHQKTGGKTPRGFLIDPKGTFVLVANQDTDEVIYFKRDEQTGLLEATETRLSIPSPVCLQWQQL